MLQRKQTTLSDIIRLAGDSWPQKGSGEVWKKILTFLNSKEEQNDMVSHKKGMNLLILSTFERDLVFIVF